MSTGKTHRDYERECLLSVMVRFNRNTEPELARWMETRPNRSKYIKELVRRDYERTRKRSPIFRVEDEDARATRKAR